MYKNNLKIHNIKNIFFLILFMFYSVSTFSQWTNPDGTPGGVDPDPQPATPIDNHIWFLLVSGISLGVFIVHKQKKKQLGIDSFIA
jgi:hypothetical protein